MPLIESQSTIEDQNPNDDAVLNHLSHSDMLGGLSGLEFFMWKPVEAKLFSVIHRYKSVLIQIYSIIITILNPLPRKMIKENHFPLHISGPTHIITSHVFPSLFP